MGITLANNAHTTLAANISSTDTTIYVDDVDSFPALDVGDYFYCTIESTTGTYEIVKVTQINSTNFVVERGQENTIAVPFNIGARVELRLTVQNLTDFLLTGSNVNDDAYSSDWNGDVEDAPSRNALYDKLSAMDTTAAGLVSDTAYASSWNGVTTVAPSKNAVYDKIETVTSGLGTIASQDADDVAITGGTIDANVSESDVTNTGTSTEPVTQPLKTWLDFNDTTCELSNSRKFWYPEAFGASNNFDARVYRFNRVFIGAATHASSDAGPMTDTDWLTDEVAPTTQSASLSVASPLGLLAIVGGSRASDLFNWSGAHAGGAQGVSGFGINDDTTGDAVACGLFGLGLRYNNALGTTENELIAANAGSVVTMTPNTGAGTGGKTVALNLTSGWPGYTSDISCLLHFGGNTHTAKATKGRVVKKDALSTSYGVGGNGVADELYTGQSQRYVDASENILSEFWGDSNGFNMHRADSSTNTVLSAARLRRDSSGTPATGIGVGLDFAVETAADNVEVGASIQAVTTDVTSTSEDFDLVIKTMAAGAAAAEVGRFVSTGAFKPASPRLTDRELGTWWVPTGGVGSVAGHTGTTAETELKRVVIPAGAVGPSGCIRITTQWGYPSSANNKTPRVKFGINGVAIGSASTVRGSANLTTTQVFRDQVVIQNVNSQSSQVYYQPAITGGGWGTNASAAGTASVDTSGSIDIIFTGQLANSGETLTLQHYLVEIMYGA